VTSPITKAAGRAAEYAPYALTLYETCPHACRYCYVPSTPPIRAKGRTAADFHMPARPRKDIIKRLAATVERGLNVPSGDPILLSFMSDPYPPGADGLTRQALDLLDMHSDVAILTKGGMRAAHDFDILKRNQWWFGQTIIFTDDSDASFLDCSLCPHDPDDPCPLEKDNDYPDCTLGGWEPRAAPYASREAALQIAHDYGVPTWVSIEPVIDPDQALDVIDRLLPYVRHWKIGKLTGRDEETKTIEARIDWTRFLAEVRSLLHFSEEVTEPGRFESNTHYIKRDLLKAAGEL